MMEFYQKYLKYKYKYIKLKKFKNTQININQYGGLDNDLLITDNLFDSLSDHLPINKIPRYAFTNEKNNKDILKWNDNKKAFDIIYDEYIFLSSVIICNNNFLSNFTIDNCLKNTLKIYNIINKIPENNYIICINYVFKDHKNIIKDFQIGITESSNLNENAMACARRGIIEEIGLCFDIENLNNKLESEIYNNIIFLTGKLSDLKNIKYDENTLIGLYGGKLKKYEYIQNKKFKKEGSKIIKYKTNIFLYDTLSNIINYLKNRYTGKLTKNHYIINNEYTIIDNKLLLTNKEKDDLEIYAVSIFDLKNMLIKIHNKDFN
jgi:hypothetical protein